MALGTAACHPFAIHSAITAASVRPLAGRRQSGETWSFCMLWQDAGLYRSDVTAYWRCLYMADRGNLNERTSLTHPYRSQP